MGASIDGDYSVSQVTLRGEAGWEIGVGSGVSVTPFVAAAYNYLSTSDFDESGSPYALSVDGSDDSFGTYEAGAKADLDLGGASLKAMAGYRWSGLDDVVDAAFSNGLSFGTDMTAELGGAFVDVDLMYAVTPAIQIGVGYDGVFGEDVTANYGSVKVEWTF
jgi:outer membrane autotransporter protein